MATDSNIRRPDWLTESEIERLKSYIASCPSPYTKEEVANLSLDGNVDIIRWQAYEAKRILTKYGVIQG